MSGPMVLSILGQTAGLVAVFVAFWLLFPVGWALLASGVLLFVLGAVTEVALTLREAKAGRPRGVAS